MMRCWPLQARRIFAAFVTDPERCLPTTAVGRAEPAHVGGSVRGFPRRAYALVREQILRFAAATVDQRGQGRVLTPLVLISLSRPPLTSAIEPRWRARVQGSRSTVPSVPAR